MAKAKLILLVSLLACGPLTPEEKGKLVKGSIDASKAGCLVLLADRTIPRDQKTEDFCSIALRGCPINVKAEVRNVP